MKRVQENYLDCPPCGQRSLAAEKQTWWASQVPGADDGALFSGRDVAHCLHTVGSRGLLNSQRPLTDCAGTLDYQTPVLKLQGADAASFGVLVHAPTSRSFL